jgi:hypothetical protein
MPLNSFPAKVNSQVDHLILTLQPGTAPTEKITALIVAIYWLYKSSGTGIDSEQISISRYCDQTTDSKAKLDATVAQLSETYNFSIIIEIDSIE